MSGKSTSAAAPRRTRHLRSAMTVLFGGSGDDLLREVIQIGLQLLDISEFFEVSPIQRPHAGASRCPQGFQLACILRLALLHEPQPVAQHFAGVLVTARPDEGLEEFFLTLRQNYISGGHWHPPRLFEREAIWHNMPYAFDRLNLECRRVSWATASSRSRLPHHGATAKPW